MNREDSVSMNHDVRDMILEMIASMDGIPVTSALIEIDKPLINYGVDSLSFIQLIVNIENKFGIVFDDSVLNQDELSTIEKIAQYLGDHSLQQAEDSQ